MCCMQASFGLSIKTGYRWYGLQRASFIWTPSQTRLKVTRSAACKPHVDSLTIKTDGDRPIPVAARTKTWVYSRPLTGNAGSNLDGGMDVCIVCVVRLRSLHRDQHSSRGVLPSVVCLTECGREASIMWRLWSTGYCVMGARRRGK